MSKPDSTTRDRSHWPVRRYALGAEPGDDIAGMTTAAQRLALVEELSAGAWALTGQPMPDRQRSDMPVILRRLR